MEDAAESGGSAESLLVSWLTSKRVRFVRFDEDLVEIISN